MRLAVPYTPCTTSSGKKTGDIITFAQFEERNILTKACNDAESGDEFNDNSIMPPLMSKEEIYAMDSVDGADHDNISIDMLENICDRSQSHPNIDLRETRYKKI